MIPGSVSKLSEVSVSLTNTVHQKADIMRVSSTATTTVLINLLPALGNSFPTICWIINSSGGNITATTAGNIANTLTLANLNVLCLVFSKATGKWHKELTA